MVTEGTESLVRLPTEGHISTDIDEMPMRNVGRMEGAGTVPGWVKGPES